MLNTHTQKRRTQNKTNNYLQHTTTYRVSLHSLQTVMPRCYLVSNPNDHKHTLKRVCTWRKLRTTIFHLPRPCAPTLNNPTPYALLFLPLRFYLYLLLSALQLVSRSFSSLLFFPATLLAPSLSFSFSSLLFLLK